MYYADRRARGLGFLFIPALISAAVGLVKGKPKAPPPAPTPAPAVFVKPAPATPNLALIGGGILAALLVGSMLGMRD